jgi:transcriptional regulator with XRE-family HTH domain
MKYTNMKKTRSPERSRAFYEVKPHPNSPARADQAAVHGTLGEFLRQTRLRRELSLRRVAFNAGLSPMYLSLLERDVCGPPSEEKLQALAQALGEQAAPLFAKAGRVPPAVAKIILRHPIEWSDLIEAGENLDPVQIGRLKETILAGMKHIERTPASTSNLDMPNLRKRGEQRTRQDARTDINFLKSFVAAPRGGASIRQDQLRAIVETAEIEERSRKDVVLDRKVGRPRS